MDHQQSDTMSNTFGGNNYSDDYSNTIDQTYQNGMNNNLYSIDNLTNMINSYETNMNGGPGISMMELL